MDHIGIDVHKRESQICIVTADGEVVEKRIRTEVSVSVLRRFLAGERRPRF
jgi:hypothetical protein